MFSVGLVIFRHTDWIHAPSGFGRNFSDSSSFTAAVQEAADADLPPNKWTGLSWF
jgi:hypothetical protein